MATRKKSGRITKAQREAFARRSKASRKGWRTRKKNEHIRELKDKLADTRLKGRNLVKASKGLTKKQKEIKLSSIPRRKPKKRYEERVRELEEEVKTLKKQLGVVPPKPPKKVPVKKTPPTKEEQALADEIGIAQKYGHWPHALAPEYLHKNGTIAAQSSRLRHMPETDVLLAALRKALAEDGGQIILGGKLDALANEIAYNYDVELREVYTLLLSPD